MLVHFDGFDSYAVAADLALEYSIGGSPAFTTSGGRFGGGAVSLSGQSFSKALAASTTEIWVGFAGKFSTYSTHGTICTFVSAAGTEVVLEALPSSGFLLHTQGYSGTIIATSLIPANFFSNIWHWIEVRYKYGTSAGVFEVWCDGVQYMSFTGNTTGYGGGSITSVVIGSGFGSVTGYFDDLYIIDVAAGGANTTRLGDCRIATLVPTGNSTNQGTPSSGSAYTCVNEAQYNTSNYITFSPYSAGLIEDYTLGSLPSTPTAIYGMRVLAIGNKSDAGSAGFFPYLSSGGTAAQGAVTPLSTSWGHAFGIFETNPHTSAAWTTSAINAMICGVKTV